MLTFTEFDISLTGESEVSAFSFNEINWIPTKEQNIPKAASQKGKAYNPI